MCLLPWGTCTLPSSTGRARRALAKAAGIDSSKRHAAASAPRTYLVIPRSNASPGPRVPLQTPVLWTRRLPLLPSCSLSRACTALASAGQHRGPSPSILPHRGPSICPRPPHTHPIFRPMNLLLCSSAGLLCSFSAGQPGGLASNAEGQPAYAHVTRVHPRACSLLTWVGRVGRYQFPCVYDVIFEILCLYYPL